MNNAGTIERAPALDHDPAIWDRVLEVNLSSPFLLARMIGRQMIERGRGKLIFTASMLSFQGGLLVPSYTAAKSGDCRSGARRVYLCSVGINVNAIAPGYVATDNTKALRSDALRSRSILERIPAGRWGEPNDLAGATVFLASRASDYVCGTVRGRRWMALTVITNNVIEHICSRRVVPIVTRLELEHVRGLVRALKHAELPLVELAMLRAASSGARASGAFR